MHNCICACVCVCAHADDCVAEHVREHVCNGRSETRDALQLLVQSDEAESSSDRFHLPSLNLNLPGCSMSNSLRTNRVCQPTSQCVFFPFPSLLKQRGSNMHPLKQQEISNPVLFAYLLCEALLWRVCTLLQGNQCWHLTLWSGSSNVFVKCILNINLSVMDTFYTYFSSEGFQSITRI